MMNNLTKQFLELILLENGQESVSLYLIYEPETKIKRAVCQQVLRGIIVKVEEIEFDESVTIAEFVDQEEEVMQGLAQAGGQLIFVPIPEPWTLEAMLKEIEAKSLHLVSADGRIYSGSGQVESVV